MIPTLPAFFDMYYTESSGKLTPDGYLYNDQMFQALNIMVIILNTIVSSSVNETSVTVDGLAPPSKTSAQITALEPSVGVGTMWYNSDLKKLQFKADAGVIETITSV